MERRIERLIEVQTDPLASSSSRPAPSPPSPTACSKAGEKPAKLDIHAVMKSLGPHSDSPAAQRASISTLPFVSPSMALAGLCIGDTDPDEDPLHIYAAQRAGPLYSPTSVGPNTLFNLKPVNLKPQHII